MAHLKQRACRIFQETLAAIDIPLTMRRKLDRRGSQISVNGSVFDLAPFNAIYAVAMGKASEAMARGLVEVLAPDYRARGIVVTPVALRMPISDFDSIVASHPLPDEGSFAAGQAILKLLATANERTLVFFLLSGGGSALVEQPLDPAVGLADMRELHKCLVNCGAPIDEMNTVRKHLSAVKGGRLAVAAPLATKITLGVSDVPDGRESALASGPSLPDPTTVSDACDVIARYGLQASLPAAFRSKFERPAGIPETPKPDDPAFRCATFELLLGRHDLFHPAHRATEALGFRTICDNTTDDWPAERAADFLLGQLDQMKRANPGSSVAIIADGEVSSPVTGNGVGGRNSAFVLRCAAKIAGRHIAVLSAGTDGIDGSSPAAGAVADGETLERALKAGMNAEDYLQRCDSYTFFRTLDDTIETGPTGNNLRDFRVLLAE